jgi:hypothetical protein
MSSSREWFGALNVVELENTDPTSWPWLGAATTVDIKCSKLLGNKGMSRKLAFYR